MRRTATLGALGAGALLVGAAIGIGGASALWRTADETSVPTIRWGEEYFAAGPVGELLPASVAEPEVTVVIDGPSLVQDVIDGGGALRVFQVDSLSQGNKGLEYVVTSPIGSLTGTGQPLASLAPSSTITWTRVAAAADCAATAVVPTDSTLPRVPVSPAYSAGTTPTSEYWCLWIKGSFADEGTYDNTAGASGTADYGGASPGPTVTASPDTWSATVTTGVDPDDQHDVNLIFSYETFRVETP